MDYPHKIISLKENETLFNQGDVPQGIYLVHSGCVKTVSRRPFTRGRVVSPEFINKIVGPGEYLGFKSVLLETPYGFSAKTLRPTELRLYPKETFIQFMTSQNQVVKGVLLQVLKDADWQETVNQMHYLASVQERITYQLVLLAERFGVKSANGLSLNLRLTRNELAQLAGTINESLSRHLTDLKDAGVLDLNGKEIIIKDLAALKAKSGNFQENSGT